MFYYPGEEVCTHLNGGSGTYETTSWNAKTKEVHAAVITQLPTKPGETVGIPETDQ